MARNGATGSIRRGTAKRKQGPKSDGGSSKDGDDQEEYEVSQVLTHKRDSNGLQYEVEWTGYPDESSWIDAEDAYGIFNLLNEYWTRIAIIDPQKTLERYSLPSYPHIPASSFTASFGRLTTPNNNHDLIEGTSRERYSVGPSSPLFSNKRTNEAFVEIEVRSNASKKGKGRASSSGGGSAKGGTNLPVRGTPSNASETRRSLQRAQSSSSYSSDDEQVQSMLVGPGRVNDDLDGPMNGTGTTNGKGKGKEKEKEQTRGNQSERGKVSDAMEVSDSEKEFALSPHFDQEGDTPLESEEEEARRTRPVVDGRPFKPEDQVSLIEDRNWEKYIDKIHKGVRRFGGSREYCIFWTDGTYSWIKSTVLRERAPQKLLDYLQYLWLETDTERV